MQPSVKIAFRQEVLEVPLEQLIALKETDSRFVHSHKYRQLRASLEHVGLIEPLAVYPQTGNRFLVTNGNLRLCILRELKVKQALCTVALDDESYTYNKRINALSPITEHFMILKAITNGVTEERIALALNVDVKAIRIRRGLLDGICPEAVELLKEKRVSSRTFVYLRKMKPLRQIEAAELMIAGKNFSIPFAASIFGVTHQDQLVKPEKENHKSEAEYSNALRETTENLMDELATARRTYGADVLSLTVICRCVDNLIKNAKIHKYLTHNHSELLGELTQVISEVDAERVVA